ncbi:hypothetical protein FGO68_gene12142 [Halteria grandinella]|uniref:Uncharacterized protein n=1 Tax=Halteria grandinella TaxID=5974 RepID=A0A8J8T402_HALGN|nr:hypothetical protein FGO68_gene12142 [Halteria grandinella]
MSSQGVILLYAYEFIGQTVLERGNTVYNNRAVSPFKESTEKKLLFPQQRIEQKPPLYGMMHQKSISEIGPQLLRTSQLKHDRVSSYDYKRQRQSGQPIYRKLRDAHLELQSFRAKLAKIEFLSFIEAAISLLSFLIFASLLYHKFFKPLPLLTLTFLALVLVLHWFTTSLLMQHHHTIASFITIWRDIMKNPSKVLQPALLRILSHTLFYTLTLSLSTTQAIIISALDTSIDIGGRFLQVDNQQKLFTPSYISVAYRCIRYTFPLSTSIVLHTLVLYAGQEGLDQLVWVSLQITIAKFVLFYTDTLIIEDIALNQEAKRFSLLHVGSLSLGLLKKAKIESDRHLAIIVVNTLIDKLKASKDDIQQARKRELEAMVAVIEELTQGNSEAVKALAARCKAKDFEEKERSKAFQPMQFSLEATHQQRINAKEPTLVEQLYLKLDNYNLFVRSFNECLFQSLLSSRLCELTRLMIEHFYAKDFQIESPEDFNPSSLYNLTATLAQTYSELQQSIAYFKEPSPRLFHSQNKVISHIFYTYYSGLQRIFTLGVPIIDNRLGSGEQLMQNKGNRKALGIVKCFEKGYL